MKSSSPASVNKFSPSMLSTWKGFRDSALALGETWFSMSIGEKEEEVIVAATENNEPAASAVPVTSAASASKD